MVDLLVPHASFDNILLSFTSFHSIYRLETKTFNIWIYSPKHLIHVIKFRMQVLNFQYFSLKLKKIEKGYNLFYLLSISKVFYMRFSPQNSQFTEQKNNPFPFFHFQLLSNIQTFTSSRCLNILSNQSFSDYQGTRLIIHFWDLHLMKFSMKCFIWNSKFLALTQLKQTLVELKLMPSHHFCISERRP